MTINSNPSNPEEVSSAPEQNDVVAEPNGAVKLPLQLKIEKALNGDEFSQELERYGFSSTAEVAGFRRLSDMHKAAQTKASGRAHAALPTYQFYREAKRRAMQAENVMRDAIASQDPVSQSLRHVRPPSLPESVTRALQEEPIRYAKPESIQSSQSPAGYLKHIYDLATTKITPAIEAFGLNVRRPDLQKLELSEDNLHQQITTLELVNEVLLAQLTTSKDSSSLFESFKTQLHPLALPFDRNIATIGTGLAQMNDMSLNEITRRIRYDYALKTPDFTLVPSPVDALNLLQSEFDALQIVINDGDDAPIKQIFGDSIERSQLKIVNVFTAATDISFDEFCQLYRDGKSISDEAGNLYEYTVYGLGFCTGGPLRLSLTEDKQLEMHSVEGDGSRKELDTRTFTAMNHLIRLHKRTGLAFHELNWLLAAGNGATESRNILVHGFDRLAHYLYWRKHYNLSVDQFVGLLAEVNGYRRLGEQDTTLMRQLFGENAALVTTTILAQETTKLSEVDTKTENGISLGDILRRGLKLSQVE